MDDVVCDSSVLISLDEVYLTRTRFNGIDTLIIRNGSEKRIQKCRLTGGGSSGYNKGYTVSKAKLEKGYHFVRSHTRFDDMIAVYSLRMEQTDGYRYPAVLINNRRFERCDTGIVRQMPLCNRRRIVDNHITVVKQSLDDISRVLWGVKVFTKLDIIAV